jgi:predicted enzyme related to lactoylglutathione lyase
MGKDEHKEMKMQKRNDLAGVIMYSSNPEALASFYANALEIPFGLHQHGNMAPHFEAFHQGNHFAILSPNPQNATGSLVPSFRVVDLDRMQAQALCAGAKRLHAPIDLGEGKQVVSFSDPDGRQFRLIYLGDAPVRRE